MAATTETVLGVFAHVDTTVRALEELRAKGYHDLTVYTPVPVHCAPARSASVRDILRAAGADEVRACSTSFSSCSCASAAPPASWARSSRTAGSTTWRRRLAL